MANQLMTSIVRIFATNGAVTGAGFLVSNKHVLTCAHVVAQASGFPADTQTVPATQVHLDFPLIGPRKILTAKVICWQPMQIDPTIISENGEDIAVLELETASPGGVTSASPVIVDEMWGHSFRTFGFPNSQDNGVYATGIVRDRQGNGWIQIEDTRATGFFVQPGFSGTPVWDDQANCVVGMVVASVVPYSIRTAFIIPISTLVKAWPPLRQYITDDLKNYLEKLYERLSELPAYYPPGFDFDRIRQRIGISQQITSYKEDEAQTREAALRAEYFVGDEEDRLNYRERAYRRSTARAAEQQEEKTVEVDWEELRNQVRRGVILGNPGAGKSWLLKYEGRLVIREQLYKLQQDKQDQNGIILPIYLRLGTLAEELAKGSHDEREAVINILRREYNLPERFLTKVRHWLPSLQCLLLLDSLEEVADDKREMLRRTLKGLAGNTQCRILLTSRIAGYRKVPFELEAGTSKGELELVTFDQFQIAGFIESWFGADNERGKLLRDTLLDEPVLKSLGSIPLLLSFICLIGSSDGTIPTRQTKLYETMLYRLLKAPWRDAQLQDQYTSHVEDKLAVLERLALHFATFDGRWHDLMPEYELNRAIRKVSREEHLSEAASQNLLKEFSERDGMLVKAGEPSQDIEESQVPYLFLHRTFHEYLVARCLAHLSLDECLKIVKSHIWFDPDWEVVIILLAGCLNDPNPLLEALLNEPDDAFHAMSLLAGRCMAEAKKGSMKQELIEQVSRNLLNMQHSILDTDQDQARDVLEQMEELVEAEQVELRWKNPLQAVETLRQSLHDKDEHVRLNAATALGQVGDPQAVGTLLVALRDNDKFVRDAAARALSQIGTPQAVKALLTVLQDEHEKTYTRTAAAQGLVQIGTPEIMQSLLFVLREKDYFVRHGVGEALKQIRDPKVVGYLLTALQNKNEDREVRVQLTQALGQVFKAQEEPFGFSFSPYLKTQHLYTDFKKREEDLNIQKVRAIETLQAILLDMSDDEYVRVATAEALGRIGTQQAVQALQASLQIAIDMPLREAVTKALASNLPLQTAEEWLTAAADWGWENWERRKHAIEILSRMGDPQTVMMLLAVVRNDEREKRAIAEDALRKMQDPRAVQTLLSALQNQNEPVAVQAIAAEALGQFADPRTLQTLLAILQEKNYGVQETVERAREVRVAAARALGRIMRSQTEEPSEQIGDPHATYTLGQVSNTQIVQTLLTILQDEKEDWDTRAAAAESLRWIGDPRAVETLLARLHDTFLLKVIGMVVKALVQIVSLPIVKEQKWAEDFLEIAGILEETSFGKPLTVQMAAVKALGEIGDPRAVQALLKALRHWLPDLREAAAEALGQIGDQQAVKGLSAALLDKSEDVREAAADALGELLQNCNPQEFCECLLWAWPHKILDEYNRLAICEMLIELGPRLHMTVGDDWPNWRKRLMPPIQYAQELGLKRDLISTNPPNRFNN